MPVLYDGKKLIPASTVGISLVRQKDANGEIRNTNYQIVINGFLLPFKGSPDSNGDFHTDSGHPADEAVDGDKLLTNLLAKQVAMEDLFATEGKTLEFQPWDGGPNLKCNPRVEPLIWENGPRTNLLPYTLNFTAQNIFHESPLGSGHLELANIQDFNVGQVAETWTMERNHEEDIWNVEHQVSAVGDRVYDTNGNLVKEPWEAAKDWVDAQSSSGILTLSKINPKDIDGSTSGTSIPLHYGDYRRVSSTDVRGGAYRLVESWIATSGTPGVIDNFNVTRDFSISDGLTKVNIEGTIQGLHLTDSNTARPVASGTRYEVADKHFSGIFSHGGIIDQVFRRAKRFGDGSLHQRPLTEAVAKNNKTGTIQYSRSYDNRPLNVTSDSLLENVEYTDDLPTRIRPVINIPGRINPIVQDTGADTQGTRTLRINLIMDRGKDPYAEEFAKDAGAFNYSNIPTPNVSGLIEMFHPPGSENEDWYVQSDNPNWNPQTLSYDRTIVWAADAL